MRVHLLILVSFFSLVSCSTQDNTDAWLESGSITIARELPEPPDVDSSHALAFMPTQDLNRASDLDHASVSTISQTSRHWLHLIRASGTATLMDGDSRIESAQAEGLASLPIGKYQVMHKQRSPLWYAPTSYFETRGLTCPPEGDKARYRRGALGEFAVFLDKTTPIHSGPLWSQEIGGIRLDEHQLSKMYYLLEVGNTVTIE